MGWDGMGWEGTGGSTLITTRTVVPAGWDEEKVGTFSCSGTVLASFPSVLVFLSSLLLSFLPQSSTQLIIFLHITL